MPSDFDITDFQARWGYQPLPYIASSREPEPSVTIGTEIAKGQKITIGDIERRSGLYVLGKPRMGKSTLLVNMIQQDLEKRYSVFFLDPHGEAIKDLFRNSSALANWGDHDGCILFDPSDEKYTFGINPLGCSDITSLSERTRAYNQTYDIFHKLWEDDWGVWLQLILENTIPVFIENETYTLAEVPMFLTNPDFREHLLCDVKYNKGVLDFWKYEFQPKQAESALTRIRSLLSNDYVKHIVGQAQVYDFSDLTEWGSFVALHLPTTLAFDIRKFIGTLFMSELHYAIRERRGEVREYNLCLYVDEFQHFATDQFADLILEGGKYGCAITLAHQERVGQFGENQKILGATSACANKILFQTTVRDAQELAPEFAPSPSAEPAEWRGGELIISPTPIEDIWDKGYPHEKVMELRSRYFWLVDLLRRHPNEKYFAFDPSRYNGVTKGMLLWEEFDDWGMYRSSAEMLRKGLSLLNKYHYDWMQGKYDRHNPASEEEVTIFMDIIECLGGVLGFRPTMRVFIPEEKGQLLIQVCDRWIKQQHAELEKDVHKKRDEALEPLKEKIRKLDRRIDQVAHELKSVTKPTAYFPNVEFEAKKKLIMEQMLIQQEMSSYRWWAVDKISEGKKETLNELKNFTRPICSDKELKDFKALAAKVGMSTYDAENLYEWDLRDLEGNPEEERLRSLVRSALNSRTGQRANEVAISQEYCCFMTYVPLTLKFGIDYDNMPYNETAPYASIAMKRLAWQTKELLWFFLMCSYPLGGELQKNPIKMPSSRFEENPRRDRMQVDLIAEMAQELSGLPRFTAYAKIIRGDNGEQSVSKPKIKTPPALKRPEGTEWDRKFADIEERITAYTRENWCKERAVVEQELQERREGWRGSRPTHKDEPPPTSI